MGTGKAPSTPKGAKDAENSAYNRTMRIGGFRGAGAGSAPGRLQHSASRAVARAYARAREVLGHAARAYARATSHAPTAGCDSRCKMLGTSGSIPCRASR